MFCMEKILCKFAAKDCWAKRGINSLVDEQASWTMIHFMWHMFDLSLFFATIPHLSHWKHRSCLRVLAHVNSLVNDDSFLLRHRVQRNYASATYTFLCASASFSHRASSSKYNLPATAANTFFYASASFSCLTCSSKNNLPCSFFCCQASSFFISVLSHLLAKEIVVWSDL